MYKETLTREEIEMEIEGILYRGPDDPDFDEDYLVELQELLEQLQSPS